MNFNTLVVVYGCILMISSLFGGLLWFAYKDDLLKVSFGIWISVVVGFVSQGVFNNLNLSGFLAYSTNIFTIILLLVLSDKTSRTTLPVKLLSLIVLAGLVISASLFFVDTSYMMRSLPFSLACGGTLLFGALYRPNKTPLDLGYRFLLAALAIHYLDYPFLRPREDLAIIGFSMGFIFTFCHSIIIPLFVMRKISERHTRELECTVEMRTIELKVANEHLEKKTAQLNEVLSDNRILLNVLVHDLVNPLNIMNGAVGILKKAPLDEEGTKWVRILQRSVDNFGNTIEHARKLQTSKNGKPKLELENVSLREIISDIKKDFATALGKKSINLEYSSTGEELYISTESHRFKNQVLANLISNAIKFSNPGGTIEINSFREQGEVVILIRDFGVGVPQHRAKDIFNEGPQTSTVGTLGEVGTGLGLPIVAHYLKTLGGSIKLLPNIEPGACFEIRLPLAPQL